MLKAGLLPEAGAKGTGSFSPDPEAALKNDSVLTSERDHDVRNDRCKRTMVAVLICGAIFVVGMALPHFIGLKCPIGALCRSHRTHPGGD